MIKKKRVRLIFSVESRSHSESNDEGIPEPRRENVSDMFVLKKRYYVRPNRNASVDSNISDLFDQGTLGYTLISTALTFRVQRFCSAQEVPFKPISDKNFESFQT